MRMIKHIVLFKVKGKDEAEKKRNTEGLKVMLEGLKGKVPELVDVETGINFSTRPVAFDLALVSQFRSEADLQAYMIHPAHQEVVTYLENIKESVAVADYYL